MREGALIRGKLQQRAGSVVRDCGGLRRRRVRVAVADGFVVGFLDSDGGKGHVRQGKVGVGQKGVLARRKYRAQRPLARVVVAMVYPFAARVVEPGGPALKGKGRGLRGVRTALWKRGRPPQARQIGCGQGGSSISGTVTVKPWASSTVALMAWEEPRTASCRVLGDCAERAQGLGHR